MYFEQENVLAKVYNMIQSEATMKTSLAAMVTKTASATMVTRTSLAAAATATTRP
jgi:hypothetical protein